MSCINERDWNDSLNKLKDNGVVILDDFFNKDMCEKLHKRMADEKNFHDDYGTYQAMDYTIEDDLTKLIVEDLHEACPELLSNFERAWSFIYNNKSKGVDVHADPSSYNINVWVTPDESVKDIYKNGLNIYNVEIPKDSSWEKYNKDHDWLRELIYKKPHVIYRVPYKYNRAIIFNASLPHDTDDVSMKPGQKNKRVSYTMLYGKGPFNND